MSSMLTSATSRYPKDVACVNIFCEDASVSAPKPYHHENLRRTLLDAAVALIGEVGPRAFTLREVARRAGVSHNAPYRHFANKDELLVAVAAEGFDQLAACMEERLAPGRTPMERLQLCGQGYVEFALRWPNHLLAMFDLPLELRAACPPEKQVGRNAFDVLLNCVLGAQAAGALPPGDPMPTALACWSMVHGIAKLAVSGNLPMDAAATLDFTLWAAQRLSHALGTHAKSPTQGAT